MNVMIIKGNEGIITSMFPKEKFIECSTNTVLFRCTSKRFSLIYDKAKTLGYNPYALMSW